MYRFASSLLASAALVFLATSALGTALADSRTFPPPRHIISQPLPPKVIATVVAHGHNHEADGLTVHGL